MKVPGKIKNIAVSQKVPEPDSAILPQENGDLGVIRIETRALSAMVRLSPLM